MKTRRFHSFLLHCPALAALHSPSPPRSPRDAREGNYNSQQPARPQLERFHSPISWGERSPPLRLLPIGEAGAGCTTRAAPPGAERGRSPEGSAGAAAPGGDGALRSGRAAARAHLEPQGGGGRTAGVTGPCRGQRPPERSGRTGRGRPGPT